MATYRATRINTRHATLVYNQGGGERGAPVRSAGDRGGCEGGGVWGVWGVGQASLNPKVETVEELQSRRKNLHMGMVKLARQDLSLTLQAALDAFLVTQPSPSGNMT